METHGDLLMLVHRVPYPPDKGDKIRSFNVLKHLAARGWQIHLCTLAEDPADLHHHDALLNYCASVHIEPLNPWRQKAKCLSAVLRGRPLSAGYYYSSKLQQTVDGILEAHMVNGVLCYCSPMAEYLFHGSTQIFSAPGRPQLIMDLVDVDSDKWHQYARRTRTPMKWVYSLESRLLKNYERSVVERFDASLLVSETEAEMLRSRTGHRDKVFGISNGVDLEYFTPAAAGTSVSPGRIVFCGAMDYLPNVDAVCWFARGVLPLIRRSLPNACFDIVGSAPVDEVKSLARLEGVRVTGRVEDVRPFVHQAALSVAPIRIARGLQNKVLEAMAMGKAVVSTPEAFEGIDAVPDRDILVAEADPESFAAAAIRLLTDEEKRNSMGVRARRQVAERYCWQTCLAGLDHLLPDVPGFRSLPAKAMA